MSYIAKMSFKFPSVLVKRDSFPADDERMFSGVNDLARSVISIRKNIITKINEIIDCVTNNTPIGTIIIFGSGATSSSYLLCDGAAVSRSTYSKLFAVIGTTYGSGDGSTTFNLPNLTAPTDTTYHIRF